MNTAARSSDDDGNDFGALYLETYGDYMRAPTVCAKAFYGFELHVYTVMGQLSPVTVAKLQKQAQEELEKPTIH